VLASGDSQLHAEIEAQAQLVAAAEIALANAERAVSQARTPHAAAEAHRRADAALIDVEHAETELHRLTRQAIRPATPRKAHAPKLTDQAPLFDVG